MRGAPIALHHSMRTAFAMLRREMMVTQPDQAI
jgi:hypothetical protein